MAQKARSQTEGETHHGKETPRWQESEVHGSPPGLQAQGWQETPQQTQRKAALIGDLSASSDATRHLPRGGRRVAVSARRRRVICYQTCHARPTDSRLGRAVSTSTAGDQDDDGRTAPGAILGCIGLRPVSTPYAAHVSMRIPESNSTDMESTK